LDIIILLSSLFPIPIGLVGWVVLPHPISKQHYSKRTDHPHISSAQRRGSVGVKAEMAGSVAKDTGIAKSSHSTEASGGSNGAIVGIVGIGIGSIRTGARSCSSTYQGIPARGVGRTRVKNPVPLEGPVLLLFSWLSTNKIWESETSVAESSSSVLAKFGAMLESLKVDYSWLMVAQVCNEFPGWTALDRIGGRETIVGTVGIDEEGNVWNVLICTGGSSVIFSRISHAYCLSLVINCHRELRGIRSSRGSILTRAGFASNIVVS